MPGFLFRRLLHAVAIVAFATMASFLLIQLAPGDAATLQVEQQGRDAAAREALRVRLGLDRPVAERALAYVQSVMRGDLGDSYSEQQPVRSVIARALPATALLSGTGLLLAALLGIASGTAQGWRPHDRVAAAFGTALTLLYTLPEVVVGIVLLGVFGVLWGVLPVGGLADPLVELTGTTGARLADRARHLVLPSMALALVWSAAIARQQRAAIREAAGAAFVRTARAKGAFRGVVLRRHAMRPALPGTVAVIGTMLPALAGGTVIIESLFAWPGMGSLLVRAVETRDAPLVAGAVIVIATAVALGTLLTDLVVGLLDPRQRAHPDA